MPDAREPFPFGGVDLGVVSTDTVQLDAVSSFLGASPDEVVDKDTPPTPPVKKATTTKTALQDDKVKDDEPKGPTGEELADSFLDDDPLKEEVDEQKGDTKDKEVTETEIDFNALGETMLQIGIFTKDAEEEELVFNSPEEFKERFLYEKKKGASEILEAFLGRFGEQYTEMFDSVFVKGVQPQDYLNAQQIIAEVEAIDLTDEANQERVVRAMLKKEGKPADYINKRIEKLKSYNDLEEEAEAAKSILVEQEKADLASKSEAKAAAEKTKQENKRNYVTAVNKILTEKIEAKEFDGIPVDAKFAQEIADYVAKERYKVGDELLTEFDKEILDLKRPENYSLRVKMAMLLKMVKTDPTLSKIQKKAVTQEKNALFQNLKKAAQRTGATTPTTNEKPKSWFPS